MRHRTIKPTSYQLSNVRSTRRHNWNGHSKHNEALNTCVSQSSHPNLPSAHSCDSSNSRQKIRATTRSNLKESQALKHPRRKHFIFQRCWIHPARPSSESGPRFVDDPWESGSTCVPTALVPSSSSLPTSSGLRSANRKCSVEMWGFARMGKDAFHHMVTNEHGWTHPNVQPW